MKSFKYMSALVALFAVSCAFAADAKSVDTGIAGASLVANSDKNSLELEYTVQGVASSTEDAIKQAFKALSLGATEKQASVLKSALASILPAVGNKSAIIQKGSVLKVDVEFKDSLKDFQPVVSAKLKLSFPSGVYETSTMSTFAADGIIRTNGDLKVSHGSSTSTHAISLSSYPNGEIIGNVDGVASVASSDPVESDVGKPLPLPTDPSFGNPSIVNDGGDSQPVPDSSIVTSKPY